jgi:hypothetical protein
MHCLFTRGIRGIGRPLFVLREHWTNAGSRFNNNPLYLGQPMTEQEAGAKNNSARGMHCLFTRDRRRIG